MMIILAFILGYMVNSMCGGRSVEGLKCESERTKRNTAIQCRKDKSMGIVCMTMGEARRVCVNKRNMEKLWIMM